MNNKDEIILNEPGLYAGSFRGPRAANQDCLGFRIYQTAPLRMAMVLCDGVGGLQHGEKASRFLVNETLELLARYPDAQPTESMFEMLCEQLAVALDTDAAVQNYNGSASTWCLVYIAQGMIMAGHMGDSRIYLFESGHPIYVSRDHSLVNDMLKAGLITEDEVASHPQRNVITKCFHAGQPDNHTKGTIRLFPFNADLQILLCSDGFLTLYPVQVPEDPGKWNREEVLSLCRLSTDTRDNVSVLYARPAEIPGASGWQDATGKLFPETHVRIKNPSAGKNRIGLRLLIISALLLFLSLAGYMVYRLYFSRQEKAIEIQNKGLLTVTCDMPCVVQLDGKEYKLLNDSDTLKTELDTAPYQCIAISNDQFKIRDTLNLRIHSGESKTHRFKLSDKIRQFQSEFRIKELLKSLTDNMVFVQGGTFTMGCTAEQGSACDSDEKPTHQVTVSSFRMGKYEVTQAEWEAVMGSNPSYFTNCPNCPVENVSWNDIQAFIGKLNTITGGNYRLPTEAEWEYAARGGNRSSGTKYSGSNDIGLVAWYDGNSGSRTHPVGQKQANALGLFDMTGNVWEWCSDWYGENYYSNSPSTNPRGPSTGTYRVLRGSSWDADAGLCRVSIRLDLKPGYSTGIFGFRLVSPGQ
jgi:formylglycine-generating enzyme required for sulfatase activity/serine/threonine protein phosphatase PrpC